MLDLVFMGTAPFAVPCLRALVQAGHRVKSVVSQPDRVRGRGMQLQPTPVKTAALELGLPVLQPEKASRPEFIDELRALAPQLIVVVAYGQILRPAVLEIPPLGCVNVHGSLLPELRGAAPIQWSILRGYRETGVTTMFMDAGMDTGDMLLKAVTEIRPEDTAGSLAERLAPLGADLLLRTVADIEAGTIRREPQGSERATYAPMLRKEDGAIDWSWRAEEIRNRIHGCNPSPGAFATRNGEPVKLWRAEVVEGSGAPGTVLDAERLVVATAVEAVRICEIQPENRARMSPEAYQRGYRVTAGEVWGKGSILHT
jgi:methionyl-tRNA formyltransferase